MNAHYLKGLVGRLGLYLKMFDETVTVADLNELCSVREENDGVEVVEAIEAIRDAIIDVHVAVARDRVLTEIAEETHQYGTVQ